MDLSCTVSTVQASIGAVIRCGKYFWHTQYPLSILLHSQPEYCCQSVHRFVTTVYISPGGYTQHIIKLKSSLKWSPQSSGLYSIQNLWDVVEWTIVKICLCSLLKRQTLGLNLAEASRFLRLHKMYKTKAGLRPLKKKKSRTTHCIVQEKLRSYLHP